MGERRDSMKIYQPMAVVGFTFGGALLLTSLLPFRYTVFAIVLAGVLFLGCLIFCLIKGFTFSRGVLWVALFMALAGTVVNTGQRIYWAHEAAGFPADSLENVNCKRLIFCVIMNLP